MPGSDDRPEPEVWRPHHPDPALVDPNRPGLHARQHPRNRLHAWVFSQHQVWVDYWGNQIEIETMSDEYVANVLGFCQAQADRIRDLVALDLLIGQLERLLVWSSPDLVTLNDICAAYELTAVSWLEQTPLFQALHRRLGGRA